MKRLSVFILCLVFSSLSGAHEHTSPFGPRDFKHIENKWTAVVAAYEPEIAAIDAAFAQMEDAQITETLYFKGVKYQLGEYKGEPIVVLSTGISITNAAMTVQMALDYFPIDTLVMMGIAGATDPQFTPGDIAVPERWYFHDESVYVNPKPNARNEYELPSFYMAQLEQYTQRNVTNPHAPRYNNFGFIHPNEVAVVREGWDSRRRMPYFSATPRLLTMTKRALETIPTITMPSGKPIQVAVGGNGVTGSVFVDNADYRNWLREVFNADVAEMESAAVAQVCFVNDIDWLIIRSVSDLAGGQKGKNEGNVFDAIASGTGTKLLLGLLDEIVTENE
ncbi:5'-methylthioadenosine/S-adenosylhomocysteine nucleosidase [Alteromonas sp. ASW11-36]|uniref:5'-methylthioadenosine/S-adenosylhomocysteine nucleosidase n=1 Tax=Alteromonas arenosi TaxID=3055817 RepID=A0ABT7SYL4_9ALTE|nr:5'-methylthioadenosine/S-adenosylhomocysteine nucleosidase [Alteromonas sp. ASW11-36]MDM7861280.1 5'-methylthioadenosine/S-adenosylhomocysteine nucleosidase [Alteromonas sp. ASW11-36]